MSTHSDPMKSPASNVLEHTLAWCASVLGPVEVASDSSKIHGDHESTTCRLHTPLGFCYLKIHQDLSHWHQEVHAYKHWVGAFGDFAPTLLAVHDEAPLALIVSELPGQIMEKTQWLPVQERAIWRSAGAALSAFHACESNGCFGPCLRDGTCTDAFPPNARDYVSMRFRRQIERAISAGYLIQDESATLQAAYELIPAFEGERPFPCHRDYCPANWLVSKEGTWAGVIDFEFSYGDVRVSDFSRDPNWSWIHRPDLYEAFFDGYARSMTPVEERQLLVAHAEYALSAIVWGHDHAFYGFEQEGHESLAHLTARLKWGTTSL